MGISIGLVGLGGFGRGFAPLFKSHPLVSRIALCDREPDRIRRFADMESWKDKFNPRDAYTSLDAICASDLDALVIITQPWLHAAQCIQAMESGKHVFSAVPIVSIPDDDETLGWCDKLIETCRSSGKHYMLGETSYYLPSAMFARRQAAAGAFGDFVYAEGEYFHDVDYAFKNLRKVRQHRLNSQSGQEWLAREARYWKNGKMGGPMHYPTHSTCGPVCVMNAHAVKATAYGFRNRNQDPFFQYAAFSNETALFKMSNDAVVRICEFREAAVNEAETFRVYGTKGSFLNAREEGKPGLWMENGRDAPDSARPLVKHEMPVVEMRDALPPEVLAAFSGADVTNVFGGHGGSHPYLVHEFVDAVAYNRQPVINAWEAVRYMAMGVMAHRSALRDGETVSVPDWGDAPA